MSFAQPDSAQWDAWLADCQSIEVPVPADRLALFQQFYTLLLTANQSVNLTRITAPQDFLDRNLLDSLTLSPLIPEGACVADIGSGAGFPAIPLALARPDLSVVAVESVGKKANFIQEAAHALGLKNITVLSLRSEEMARDGRYRAQFDVVTARAVATLPTLLELCMPLVKVKGRFLAMKGLNAEVELAASQKALKVLATRYSETRTFGLEKLQGSRLLVFEKTAHTQDAYPRNSGLPSKKPI
ncbi:16S rRNA (guanine(527)-N(7))-methyltransferase RsmG [Vampirovibrio sp.]|uniref:16S rRNA (guanine(527)-N(7))-methyltransferase RsmG n=1 Tax=Vampirovibrio sp. TaxID=2717857 RepID=UPI003593794D